MDKKLAKLVALTAFRSSAEINSLVPLFKEHCSEEERQEFGVAIATASAAIYHQVLQKIFKMYPDIEEEFDEQLQKFGRIF